MSSEQQSTAITGPITVIQGDITTLKVDAIVNAANERLGPGFGVNKAIRDAAGPDLEKEHVPVYRQAVDDSKRADTV